MPGMMDTILNLGLNDEAAEGLAAATGNKRFAYDSYRRLIQMYGEVVDGIDGVPLRAGAERLEERSRGQARRRARRRRPRRAGRDIRWDLRGRDGRSVPHRRARAAAPRRPRRLRILGHAARAGLPRLAGHPRRPRHRGQRRADGLRQQGRRLRHRRSLHPRSGHRRARPVRRVPRQRAGGGRRRRHSHAGAARGDEEADAGGLRRADGDDPEPRGALPRHAGHRVHGRAGQALPPPDPGREAHSGGRAQSRGRDGGGGADRARGGGRAHRSRPARPAPAPDARPDRALRRRVQRTQRVTGRGLRRDRVRRGYSRRTRQGGRERDPRALGDDAGRHPRPDRGGRDPDRARRHDLPRGRGRARDGEAVRRRLRGPLDRRDRGRRRRWATPRWPRAT